MPGSAPNQRTSAVTSGANTTSAGSRRPAGDARLTREYNEVLAGGKHLEPELIEQPARVLAAVQRIVARGVRDGDFRPVDPLLTHLSLVGSLVFFFATRAFRERGLASRRPAISPPDAAAYVAHMQDLLTHGLAAARPAARRRA